MHVIVFDNYKNVILSLPHILSACNECIFILLSERRNNYTDVC